MAWLDSGVEKGAAGLNPARTPTLTLSDLLTLSLPRPGVAGLKTPSLTPTLTLSRPANPIPTPRGVAGIITPSSGGGTGPNTGPQTRQVTPPG